jgi:TM2 domain-containing membrane protein YozV
MPLVKCQECGSDVSQSAPRCPRCGFTTGTYAGKSKGLAIVLAIFLGGLGIHKFYLGRIGAGFLYLLFSWTFIPAVLGVIDAILLATKGNRQFSGGVTSAVVGGLEHDSEGKPKAVYLQPALWAVVAGVVLLIIGISQAR